MQVFLILVIISVLKLCNTFVIQKEELFELSIIHINDFHARFEPINKFTSVTCKPEIGQTCVGGYAKVVSAVKKLKQERRNPIYLNAGDNFQGTLWYNVHRWNVTAHFLNLLEADAMTIGNHEFDHGINGVTPFLDAINSPILLSNVDNSFEPTFKNFSKSLVIEREGRKIGIIGVILKTTDNIANTGDLKFLDEVDAVKEEIKVLQNEHDDLNIIILLTHCGLDVDKLIAKNVGSDVDIIVGGHSHTYLYDGENPSIPGKPMGKYPEIIEQDDGHKVLIVQASAYTKLVGDIVLHFDSDGIIQKHSGNPIYLDDNIEPDAEIEKELIPWKVDVDAQGKRAIGHTKVDLQKSPCSSGECNLGNFMTDGFVAEYARSAPLNEKYWTQSAIAMTNVGGIRADLSKGEITFGDLITVLPFENTLNTLDLRGDYLVAVLEHSVSVMKRADNGRLSSQYMLQISGLQVQYNVTKRPFERVVSVKALCSDCKIPKYEPIDMFKQYKVIMPSFLAGGGDGFLMIKDHGQNMKVGAIDSDAIEYYIKRMDPITQGLDNRIKIIT